MSCRFGGHTQRGNVQVGAEGRGNSLQLFRVIIRVPIEKGGFVGHGELASRFVMDVTKKQ